MAQIPAVRTVTHLTEFELRNDALFSFDEKQRRLARELKLKVN